MDKLRGTCIKSDRCEKYLDEGCINPSEYDCYEGPKIGWQCKYCGENETPKCHKCVSQDGKLVSDEIA